MIGKISLGLNILLIAAVAFLFTKVQPQDDVTEESVSETTDAEITPESTSPEKSISIAYILGDSINEKYKFLEDSKDELIRRSRRSDDKLRREMESMEKRYIELMQKQQTGGFTSEQEVMAAEQELQDRQLKLEEMQNTEAQNLQRFERKMNSEFFDRMQAFLERYAEEKGIEMVVNIQEGGSVLYSQAYNDVTSEVLKGLNEEYEAEQAQEKAEEK